MKTSSVFCLLCKMMEVMKKLARYFDMFTGISGFRAGLDCCEIDKFSDADYCAICDLRKDEFFYPDTAKKRKNIWALPILSSRTIMKK